jgi:hypothetical protein
MPLHSQPFNPILPVTFARIEDSVELVNGGWLVGCTKFEVSVLFNACVAGEVLEGPWVGKDVVVKTTWRVVFVVV